MNLPERFYLDIQIIRKTKIATKVLLPNEIKSPLIIDSGASFTLMSHNLFAKLNLKPKDKANTRIIGLNSEEESYSTLIPSFVIGNIDLGEVRVAVGTMRPEFQDAVILGMNILGCFNYNLSISNKEIELRPRFRGNLTVWNRCLKTKDLDIENLSIYNYHEK